MATIILDNGASAIKTGILHKDPDPKIITNAIVRSKGDKKTYFGHEIAQCRDYSSLHYRLPFEKGYLVDWDAQKAIWDGVFSDQVHGVDTTQSSLLITEPYFNLPNIQDTYDQLIFEEYEFSAYYRCTPASLIPYGNLFAQPGLPPAQCTIVVDSGFSFTHVVPMIDGQIVWKAVKRLDVGGKLLTNHLKELISFRQWNMMDETYIMNHVKETCCFVSSDYKRDIEKCRVDPKLISNPTTNTTTTNANPIVQEYLLPDLSTNRKGRVRAPGESITGSDQILVMNNERFAVPELLFRPDDVGLDQAGLPSTIAYAISLLPPAYQGMFWANIGLIGGCTMFSGFRERLLDELRSLAPVDCEVCVYTCDDPITEAYKSAYAFAASDRSSPNAFARNAVTRAEYAESGSNASRRKFRDWNWKAQEPELELEPVRERLREKVGLRGEASSSSASLSARGSRQQLRDADERISTPATATATATGRLGRTRSSRSAGTGASASASVSARGRR